MDSGGGSLGHETEDDDDLEIVIEMMVERRRKTVKVDFMIDFEKVIVTLRLSIFVEMKKVDNKVSSNGTLIKTATVTIMVVEAHFNNTKWSSCNTRCHLILFHSFAFIH